METTLRMKEQVDRLQELGWYHSIEVPGGPTIEGLQSIPQLRERLAQFPIPQDLRGKRVLDVGAWDGWFSFEMERRGAAVVAMDSAQHHRLGEAKALLQSSVECVTADICRVTPSNFGHFDYVLFFGVLYHLKHPLLALENVCAFAKEAVFVESYICDLGESRSDKPHLEFYEGEELAGQFDNWFGPNVACLQALCRTAGFARVNLESVLLNRAHLSCYKKWPTRPPSIAPDLVVVSSQNAVTLSPWFSGNNTDEYVNIWFKSQERLMGADDIFPEVGLFGSRPVHFSNLGQGSYMLNCKLPLGLPPGAHSVSLSTARGRSANQGVVNLGNVVAPSTSVDGYHEQKPVLVRKVTDGFSWRPNNVALGARGGFLSIWVENFPTGIAANHVALRSQGWACRASFVSLTTPDGLTQINGHIPSDFPLGHATFHLDIEDLERATFEISVTN